MRTRRAAFAFDGRTTRKAGRTGKLGWASSRASFQSEQGQEFLHPGLDQVANLAKLIERQVPWVGDVPLLDSRRHHERALITTPKQHHGIENLKKRHFGKSLRAVRGEVVTDFLHCNECQGMNLTSEADPAL